jgi:hypothetical protein
MPKEQHAGKEKGKEQPTTLLGLTKMRRRERKVWARAWEGNRDMGLVH